MDTKVVLTEGGRELDSYPLMAPGEVSIKDGHRHGKERVQARAIRIRTGTKRAFQASGPVAERFLRSAAAVGTSRLGPELADIITL